MKEKQKLDSQRIDSKTYEPNINQKLSKARNIGRRGLDFEVSHSNKTHELAEDKKIRLREKVSKIKDNSAKKIFNEKNEGEAIKEVQADGEEYEEIDKGMSRFGEFRKKKLRKPF